VGVHVQASINSNVMDGRYQIRDRPFIDPLQIEISPKFAPAAFRTRASIYSSNNNSKKE
jgi:hypothetical protein